MVQIRLQKGGLRKVEGRGGRLSQYSPLFFSSSTFGKVLFFGHIMNDESRKGTADGVGGKSR